MSFALVHAWILRSIGAAGSRLDELIGMADAIMHAIPTTTELEGSLGWLEQKGFLRFEEGRWHLEPSASELLHSCSRQGSGFMEELRRLETEFEKMDPVPTQFHQLTDAEVHQAFEKYKWEFRAATWQLRRDDRTLKPH